MTSPPPSETGATAEERIKKALGLMPHATMEDIAFYAECLVADAQRLHEEKMALLYPDSPSLQAAPILARLIAKAKRSAHLEDARALRNRAASAKSMIDGGDRYWLGWVEGQHDAVAAILGVCQTCLHEAHPERYCEHTNGHVCGCPGDALSLTGPK